MGIHYSLGRCLLLLSLLLAPVSFCIADETASVFHVAGSGECADCAENNFRTSQAFPGLLVSIDCKLGNGDDMQRVAAGELDENGGFLVDLPKEVVDESGKTLKQDCFAQLHSAAAAPCPVHDGVEAAKIVLKSEKDGKQTFGPNKNLKFSTALCTSKLLWPVFKYPPFPNLPWKKSFPKFPKKPLLKFGFGHHKFPKHKPLLPPLEKPPVVIPPVKKPPVEIPPVKKPAVEIPPVKKHHVVIPPVEIPPVKKPPVEIPPVKKPPVEIPPVKKPPVHPSLPFFKHPFHKPLPIFKHPFKKPLPLFKPPFEKPVPFFKPPFKKPFPEIPPKIPHA